MGKHVMLHLYHGIHKPTAIMYLDVKLISSEFLSKSLVVFFSPTTPEARLYL